MIRRAVWSAWVCALLAVRPAGAAPAPVLLESPALAFSAAWVPGQGAAVTFRNRLPGGRTLKLADDFLIRLDDARDLRPADFDLVESKCDPAAGTATLSLQCRPAPLAVDVTYELPNGAAFLRKRLALRPTGEEHPLVSRIDVCRWLVGEKAASQGFGQPVCFGDFFMGLEYPAGDDVQESPADPKAAGGVVRLRHFPGRKLDGPMESKTAVVGVAAPGRCLEAFRAYLRTIQKTPADQHLFVNYNTWWTLMPPTEQNCLDLIKLFKARLFDKYGESFDTFTIDDGWDNKDSIWEIRKDRFPNGFAPLLPALKQQNARLGLWLSPSSGYGHAPWGGRNGYELNSNPWFLCLAGPKYHAAITGRVPQLVQENGLAFYKFDGFGPDCSAPGHGHLPGPAGREANVDAYIDLLQKARAANPNIYLDPTCGIWLSPWWLQYADSLWGNVSGDYPDPIVPAPIIRDSCTTTRDAIFRQRCQEHPAYPPEAMEHLGIIVITPEPWEDDAMAVLGRGCRLLTLYINPKFFTGERDWEFLARAMKWARRSSATLTHTRLIGGDPFQREPYGFAHFAGARGILSARNPFVEPARLEVRLDESAGLSPSQAKGPLVAQVVYPYRELLPGTFRYGSRLSLPLEGCEQLLVEVFPRSDLREPTPAGCRYEPVAREPGRLTYALYGGAARLAGPPAQVGGRPVRDGGMLSGAAGPEPPALTVDDARLLPAEEGARSLAGTAAVSLPPGTKAELLILCEPGTNAAPPVICRAECAGRPLAVQRVAAGTQGVGGQAPHAWEWFRAPVPAPGGALRFEVALAEGKTFFSGRLGAWLRVEQTLPRRTVTLALRPGTVPADPGPLPIRQGVRATTLRLAALQPVTLGTRWAGRAGDVRLDETEPDASTQGWGKLEKNRSVWEKPLLIHGVSYEHGLGTHASSRVSYSLAGGGFKTFRCLVGRDEHADDGAIRFQVLVNGKIAFDSGVMTRATPAKKVEVSLAGAARLELVTLDGGDGINGDHGDWVDAALCR